MKYSAALVAALAAFATAADLSIFPECSRQCITDAAAKATTCGTDYACVCEKMNAVKEAAVPCVLEKCGADVGIGQVLPAADKFCDEVKANPPTPSSSEAPPASSSAAPEPTKSEEEPPATTSSPPPEPTDDEEEEEPTSAPGSSITSVTPPTKTNEPPKSTSSVATGGAAGKVMGLGMVVLGAVAAL